jgi:uncharacterized protein (TIGR02268 family)
MSRAPSLCLLALPLLLTTGAAAQSPSGRKEEGARLIELGTEPSRQQLELRISPTLSTVVLFDTPPSSVQVEDPRRFRRVRTAGDTLTLVPSAALPVGTRLKLTVHFQDGHAPEHAVLTLVVDEGSAERQVEVHRRPRLQEREPMRVEVLHEENQQLHQALEALRDENQRLRQAMALLLSQRAKPGGLGELFANGPLKEADLVAHQVESRNTRLPEQPLQVRAAWVYRLGSHVALLLELENTSSTRSWQVGDASLKGPEGVDEKVLDVWVEARLGPGERGHLVLGKKASRKATRGSFTLKLQGAEGGETVTLRDIVFP